MHGTQMAVLVGTRAEPDESSTHPRIPHLLNPPQYYSPIYVKVFMEGLPPCFDYPNDV
jgi:hypothetical protein